MAKAATCLGLFFVLFFSTPVFGDDGCVACHGNAERMREYGYPRFTLSQTEVEAQTKMPGTACAACHGGDPKAASREDAHRGLQTLKVIGTKWDAMTRDKMSEADLKDWSFLEPRGKKRATQLGPKVTVGAEVRDNPKFKLLLYHDKNPETLAFNPAIAEKTCGACHGEIVKSFLKSPMGGGKGAHTQSQYRAWTVSPGPQS